MDTFDKLKIIVENENSKKDIILDSISDAKILYRKSRRLTMISDMGIDIKYTPEPDGVVDNLINVDKLNTIYNFEPSISAVDMSIESNNTALTSVIDMSITESDIPEDIPNKDIEDSILKISSNMQRNILNNRHFVNRVAMEKIKLFNE